MEKVSEKVKTNEIKVSAKKQREALKAKGIFHSNNDFALIVKDRLHKLNGAPIERGEIIDICVGAGNLLNVFSDETFDKFGIDIEPEFVRLANEAGIESYEGNALTMPNPFKRQFDFIIGNYPFSLRDENIAKECHTNLINGKEAEFFKGLPPLSNILDSAFICKNLEYLVDDGLAVIVGFPGILYRSKKERDFREWLVEKRIIKSIEVIQGKFFDDTNTQVIILSIDKKGGYDEIEFIDSLDKEFGVTGKASIEEIRQNDYNLSINRYAKKEELIEPINIKEINNEINLSVVKNIKNQLRVNLLIDSLENNDNQNSLYLDLINMLEKALKEAKKENKKIPKEEARKELIARTLFDYAEQEQEKTKE